MVSFVILSVIFFFVFLILNVSGFEIFVGVFEVFGFLEDLYYLNFLMGVVLIGLGFEILIIFVVIVFLGMFCNFWLVREVRFGEFWSWCFLFLLNIVGGFVWESVFCKVLVCFVNCVLSLVRFLFFVVSVVDFFKEVFLI